MTRELKPTASTDARTSLWTDRDFVAFWVGETVSLFGTQVTFVALPLVAVLQLDVGTGELGVLRFAEYLPFLTFTLLFGVLVDRVRRRPLMILSNLTRALLVAMVPLSAMFGLIHLPLLVAVAFVVGTCAALFEVCWLSYVPTLVHRDRLVDAMGKVSASHAVAEVAGPGLGGLLVQIFTAPVAVTIDAVSYLVATGSLVLVRHREPAPARTGRGRRNIRSELVDGLRFTFGQPYIRATVFAATMGNFFGLLTETVFMVYAVRQLHLGPGLIGLVFSAVGLGGLLGAVLANRIARRFPLGRSYVVARVISSVGPVLLALAAGSTAAVTATCMAGFLLWQAGLANTNVINASLRQAVTPEHLRGRMNASARTLVFGAMPMGALAGGLSGHVLGLHGALWLGAVGYTASLLPIVLSPLRSLRNLPAQP